VALIHFFALLIGLPLVAARDFDLDIPGCLLLKPLP
jgi:hypothetical protein